MPGSSRICTVSPMPRNSLSFQSPQELSPGGSFFDEAIDSSPIAMELPIASTQERLSQDVPTSLDVHTGGIADSEQQIKALAANESNMQKPSRRPRNRKTSQVSNAQSENSASDPREPPKPRKRGRKPRKQTKELKLSDEQEDPDEESFLKDPRRRRILERNRIAATKCRLRKRDEASALATKEQAMEDQNRYLSSCFDSLTTEIYHLKTQLLRHTDCNCHLIQKYIANEAKKSVEGLMGCTSAFNAYDAESLTPEHRGSCSLSSVESMSLQTPDTEHMAPIWPNPFQESPAAPETKAEIFEAGMDPYHKMSISSDTLSHPHVQHMPSVAEYRPDLYINMADQHAIGPVAWNTHWGFQ